MAVAFDAVSSSGAFANANTKSWTHTPSGTPSAVAILVGHGFNDIAVTSVTYGGVACASGVAIGGGGGGGTAYRATIWGLPNPPSGAQTVVVNLAGNDYGACFAITVTGSDTSTCFSNTASAFTTTTTPSVTCTSVNQEFVVDCLNYPGGTLTVGAGQTERARTTTATTIAATSSEPSSGTSVVMSWTVGATALIPIVAASFKLEVPPPGDIKTLTAVGINSVKTRSGVSLADIKTISGVDNF